MNKQILIIHNLPVLFSILNEIKENFSFEIHETKIIKDVVDIKNKLSENYLILSLEKDSNFNESNLILIQKLPVKIFEIVEKINLNFLKINYDVQSNISIGDYTLNINSREISNDVAKLKLTEREIEIILYLKNSKLPQSIENLQKKVWGHNLELETHTVETHIYRLRKKINRTFKNDKFILSTKEGYKIL